MHSSKNILAIIENIETVPDEKRLRAFDEIMPIIKIIISNTEVFKNILNDFNSDDSTKISDHISAIKIRSEQSADKIIDAAYDISQNLLSVPESQKKKIEASINQIYEGCNFQDLVSQHAKEINLIISHLTAEMTYMEKVIQTPLETEKLERPKQQERENQHLVNGPTTDISTQSDQS
jgi:chemotaxis regulatin CheY-phosphate phosphatase CheZ